MNLVMVLAMLSLSAFAFNHSVVLYVATKYIDF